MSNADATQKPFSLKQCTSFSVRFADANICGEVLQGTHCYATADLVT